MLHSKSQKIPQPIYNNGFILELLQYPNSGLFNVMGRQIL